MEVIIRFPVIANRGLSCAQPTNDELFKHVVRRVRMVMLFRVRHSRTDILPCAGQHDVITSGVVRKEVRDVVDLAIARNPAA